MMKLVFQTLFLLAVLAGGATGAAAASNGNQGNGGDREKSEKSERADKPDKKDNGSNGSNAGNGADKANESRGAKPKAAGAAAPAAVPGVLPQTNVDAEIVLPEVLTEEALSLSELRTALARVSSGRMLDIALAVIDGRLVYEVTVLEAGNVARHVVIDAKSGQEIGDPR